MKVDPTRVRRALALEADQLEDGSFVVRGGSMPHHVRGRTCDCPDAVHRPDTVCKHRLSVYFTRTLDDRIRAALLEAVGDVDG